MSCANEFLAPFGMDASCQRAGNFADRFDDHGEWMDGWETRRRRAPGYEWMMIVLGARGCIDVDLVDIVHFKGKFPDLCSVQRADLLIFGDGLAVPTQWHSKV